MFLTALLPPGCRSLLRPSRARQYEALWAVLSATLWKVASTEDTPRVIVAVPQDKAHVPHSQAYFQDGVTEKVIHSPSTFPVVNRRIKM